MRRGLGRARIVPFVALALGLGPAAQAETSPDGACGPEGSEPVTVTSVAPDFSLLLADGRTIRLAGADPVHDTLAQPEAAREARGTLNAWLGGKPALLRTLAPTPDRWNRWAGLVFAPARSGESADLSVALAMVDAGLARGRPQEAAEACWPALLRAEDGARVARLGLWSDPYYAVLQADDGAALARAVGSSVVVEGRVAHVGQTRSHMFLDLGQRRGGLALRIARRALFILDQGGSDQSGWVGRRVRARGTLDDRGGLRIDLRDRWQLEILPGPAAP